MDTPVLKARGRGCAMKLVSLSISMVEEITSMWVMPHNILVSSRIEGQMSKCVTEETGAVALSRS